VVRVSALRGLQNGECRSLTAEVKEASTADRNVLAQHADRAGVGLVTVRGDAIGGLTCDRLRGTEEGLCRRHFTLLAQHRVDKIAMAVDGALEKAPLASTLQIRLLCPSRTGQDVSCHRAVSYRFLVQTADRLCLAAAVA
jgi:hypothetical protein